MDRRTFMQWSAAAVTAQWAATHALAQSRGSRETRFDPWIEVNPRHLAQNVAEVARRAGGRPILAVIKNNGYGLGVVPIARIAAPLPQIRGLAVIKLEEAMAIRDAGITSPVLLLGPFGEADLAEMQAREIMPMVYTPIGDALERLAAHSGRAVKIHVCIDPSSCTNANASR
jgi:alanine racemase